MPQTISHHSAVIYTMVIISAADGAMSDWTIRMTATDTAVIVHARGSGGWQILRVANFIPHGARAGPMACSPLSSGLRVMFTNYCMGPVPGEPLYISD